MIKIKKKICFASSFPLVELHSETITSVEIHDTIPSISISKKIEPGPVNAENTENEIEKYNDNVIFETHVDPYEFISQNIESYPEITNTESEIEKNNDTDVTFETHFDSYVFIHPNKNDSIITKLKFLEHHPVQPIISNNSKVKFNPKILYFRQMENNDIVERKWVSYCSFTNKVYCSICMAFSVDLSNSFVNGVVVNIKNIYVKVQKHEKSEIHKNACESYIRACLVKL